VFLDFWATWCPPCVQSMPEVQKLHEEYAGKGVAVFGVNMDDDSGPVAAFVKDNGITYPILLGGLSSIGDEYRVSGIPMFVLIDQNNNVRRAWVGFAGAFPDEWREQIDALLKK
jgi:thiol-disulfide isomerase/thioredoxin